MSLASHSTAAPSRAASPAPQAAALAPGPRGGIPFARLFEARRDRLAFFRRMARDYGDYVDLRFGPYRYFIVNHPDGARHVLVDNHRNYTKSRHYRGLKLVLGEGLLTSEGDFWKRQRRLAQPAFHRERLASFARVMASDTAGMLARWREAVPDAPFDLHQEMMRLTLRIVTRTLFSTDSDQEADAVGHAMTVTVEHVNDYADSIVRIPPWIPTPKNVRFVRARRTLDALVMRIIDERRKLRDKPNDLLSMLMSAQDEDTREQMTDRQLRDEVMTLVAAGHETTANALSWAIYLLAQHPQAFARLRAEIDSVLGDRPPAIEDLPRLPFARAVLEESMRLYPPAWIVERQAIADDCIGGYRVPRGTAVAVSPYTLHRHPRFWQDPEAFDPDRFTPDASGARPKFVYMPFGGGPRLCIGNAFAMMEAQIILAMLVRAWSFELCPGHAVTPEPWVTLRPGGGLLVTRAPRA